jgi:hypothetical protein
MVPAKSCFRRESNPKISLVTRSEFEKTNRFVSSENRTPRFANFPFSKLASPADLDRAKAAIFPAQPACSRNPCVCSLYALPGGVAVLTAVASRSGTSVLSGAKVFLYPQSYCRLAPPRLNSSFNQEAPP